MQPEAPRAASGRVWTEAAVDAGLKRLCRDRCRRYAARSNLPLDTGLAPRAHSKAAAARGWFRVQFDRFIPPLSCIPGCDTDSEGPLYPTWLMPTAKPPYWLGRTDLRYASTASASARDM